jgi:cbb3-type cytochrome oxidase maturation protein
MSILYVLIPLGLVLVFIGIWAFFWAVGNGQFDDLETPGWSVLVDHAGPGEAARGQAQGKEPERPGAGAGP